MPIPLHSLLNETRETGEPFAKERRTRRLDVFRRDLICGPTGCNRSGTVLDALFKSPAGHE
jgi:hypothetical protein